MKTLQKSKVSLESANFDKDEKMGIAPRRRRPNNIRERVKNLTCKVASSLQVVAKEAYKMPIKAVRAVKLTVTIDGAKAFKLNRKLHSKTAT